MRCSKYIKILEPVPLREKIVERVKSLMKNIYKEDTIMKLEDFIGMEEPWEYNFEFECEKFREDFKPNEKVFERYFTYKATGLKLGGAYEKAEEFIKDCKAKYKIDDCDSCELTQEIYFALWGNKYGGDTMNSVQFALNVLYAKSAPNLMPKPKGRKNVSIRFMLEHMQATENFCGLLTENFKESDLIEYIENYHTLGNFVLVPRGFNTYRSSKFKDYWDSSLECLHVAQLEKNRFKWYINHFFLWDYVEVDNNSYKERQISPRDKKDIKKYIGQFKHFFTETVNLIKRRGKFMTAMLMIENENSNLYTRVRDRFFDQNSEPLHGINDAAEKILKEFREKIPENTKGILEKLEKESIFKEERK